MNKYRSITKDEKETMALAQRLAGLVRPGDILCLFGDLGSGKTTFVKGLAKGLRIKAESVHSPTFVLMNIYDGRLPVFHFDLYRLNHVRDLDGIGYDEFLYGDGVAVVEWADKLDSYMPQAYFKIELKHKSPEQRSIVCTAVGRHYDPLIKRLAQ